MTATAASRFNEAFDAIVKEVEFNRDWSNGTGYFDNAVMGPKAPRPAPGECWKTATPSGRKIIIVGTRLNNVVIFERYDADKNIIVANYGSNIAQLNNIKTGALDYDSVCNILGEFDHRYNIGKTIEQVYDACKRYISPVKEIDIRVILRLKTMTDIFQQSITASVIEKTKLTSDAIQYGISKLCEYAKNEKWPDDEFKVAADELCRIITKKIN